jgi:CDP-6-deoxy-D-xylo-4-hexulose-3-dehydrase
MNYPLTSSNWNEQENKIIYKIVKSKNFTMGNSVKIFEEEFSKYIGMKYSVMVNSGSSANLLGLNALFFIKKNFLKEGDEVLAPAISWSTTYSPIQQLKLKLKLIDVDINTINLDEKLLEKAISKKTKVVIAVNILGLPCNLIKIKNICKNNKVFLFEDNCESLGASIKRKKCGSFGDISTHSFFYSHHMCTMEGGMISTNNFEIYCILRSLRAHGWTRDLNFKNPLIKQNLKKNYEKYNFILPGYNVRPLEMSGAIGSLQIKKLDKFIRQRRKNYHTFNKLFSKDERFITQKKTKYFHSSFAFPMIFKNSTKAHKKKIYNAMKKNNIQYRLITGGCFTKQPYSKYFNFKIYKNLKNSINIHNNGFTIGNHSRDLTKELMQLKKLFDKI